MVLEVIAKERVVLVVHLDSFVHITNSRILIVFAAGATACEEGEWGGEGGGGIEREIGPGEEAG